MKKALVYGGLLLSAFSPLLLALALLFSFRSGNAIGWALVAASILPIAFLGIFLQVARAVSPQTSLLPVRTRQQDQLVLAFVSSYLLPVATSILAVDSWSWVATGVLLLLLVLIYLRGNLLHLNPVLSALGYRLYAIDLENGVEIMLLSRHNRLAQKAVIDHLTELAEGVYIQKGRA